MSDTYNLERYRRSLASVGKVRWLRYALFPPDDLLRSVFEVAPRASADSLTAEAACMHRYPGPYQIGVVCSALIENPVKHVGRVRLEATFEDSVGLQRFQLERDIERTVDVWWRGTNRNGFGLSLYVVPDEVPIHEPLLCRLRVVDIEGALRSYSPSAIYSRSLIRK